MDKDKSQTNPQVTARSGRKSADFSYSQKKVNIRNAFADETRNAVFLICPWIPRQLSEKRADQELDFRPTSEYLTSYFKKAKSCLKDPSFSEIPPPGR